jgi:predicted RNA-binding protein Jag
MAEKEKRYKVKGRIVADYEIVVQALNADEAAYFANDIDIDRWREVSTDWKITEVTRNYFLKVVEEKDSVTLNDVSHRE